MILNNISDTFANMILPNRRCKQGLHKTYWPVKKAVCKTGHTDLQQQWCTSTFKKSAGVKCELWIDCPKKYDSINPWVAHWSWLFPCHCQHQSSLPQGPTSLVGYIIIIRNNNDDDYDDVDDDYDDDDDYDEEGPCVIRLR